MLVAVIADIHGNIVSLRAVLEDIRRANVAAIVCLGDVASTGPQPRQCVELLRSLDCRFVLGNADEELLNLHEPEEMDENTQRVHEISVWCAAQLSAADKDFLSGFAATVSLPLADGASLLCYHGTPRSFDEVINATTPEDELDEIFGENIATVLAGGHTHIQMLRRYRESLLLNPGSVGLPYEFFGSERLIRSPPWAEYALVHSGPGGSLGVELRRVPVDAPAVAASALSSGMPHADWWAHGWESSE